MRASFFPQIRSRGVVGPVRPRAFANARRGPGRYYPRAISMESRIGVDRFVGDGLPTGPTHELSPPLLVSPLPRNMLPRLHGVALPSSPGSVRLARQWGFVAALLRPLADASPVRRVTRVFRVGKKGLVPISFCSVPRISCRRSHRKIVARRSLHLSSETRRGSPWPLRVRSVDRPLLRRKGSTSTWTQPTAVHGSCTASQRVPDWSSWREGR